jgi:hypothetical protein
MRWVPVPHHFGSGLIFLVPLSFVGLVPSILGPLDRGGWMVIKNANHCKTSITIYAHSYANLE